MIDDPLIRSLLEGNRMAVARAISIVEASGPRAEELLQAVFRHTGAAHRVGITGSPGSGKSTLINQLIAHFRNDDKTVAVLAIDPTSPCTRGALLGDRIRMRGAEEDNGVYIRSMAARGASGGLSHATHDATNLLDAAGFDYILIETVGVGQSELDITRIADTVMAVLVPESGDAIQAMKAGLMEVADIFALNKCDRPDSGSAYTAIRSTLDLRSIVDDDWTPGIVKVTACEGQGIDDLAGQITRHRNHLMATDGLRQRREQRLQSHVRKIVEKTISAELWDKTGQGKLAASIQRVLDGELSPQELARSILDGYRKS